MEAAADKLTATLIALGLADAASSLPSPSYQTIVNLRRARLGRPLGLAYAVDFLQEVESSFNQAEAGKKKAGAVWTKLGLAEAWKKGVFKWR